MKRSTYSSKKFPTIILEEYASMNEFLKVTDSRPSNGYGNASHSGRNFDKERELLVHGWNEKTQEILSKISKSPKANTMTKLGVQRYESPVGFAPIVPNIIAGLPKTMYNSKRIKPKNSRIVEIIFDPGCLSGVSAERVTNHGVELLVKIKELELAGYRVKLWVQGFKGRDSSSSKPQYFCRIPLKHEYEPLDISRIAYPLAHDGMLRTMVFYWYEHMPDVYWHDSYGKSIYSWCKSDQEDIISAVVPKGNQYYVNLNTNIDEVFKSLNV